MNVYMPSEGVVVPPRRRFLDWRFLAALAALLLIALLCVGAWRNWESRERSDAERAALIEQLHVRGDQIDKLLRQQARMQRADDRERRAAHQSARDASRERRQLIKRQEYLIRVLQRYDLLPADIAPLSGDASPSSTAPKSTTSAPPPAAPSPSSSPPPSGGSGGGGPSSASGGGTPGKAPAHSNAGGNGKGGGHGPGGKPKPGKR